MVDALTAQELATLLDVSLVRIGQLRKEGVIETLPGEKQYPVEAITRYVRFVKGGGHKGGAGNLADEIEREKLRKLRRENDVEEGQVAPVELLTEALQKAGAIIVANLESLPLLMKRHWPEITGDQVTMVKKAVAECRNAVADMQINLDDGPS